MNKFLFRRNFTKSIEFKLSQTTLRKQLSGTQPLTPDKLETINNYLEIDLKTQTSNECKMWIHEISNILTQTQFDEERRELKDKLTKQIKWTSRVLNNRISTEEAIYMFKNNEFPLFVNTRMLYKKIINEVSKTDNINIKFELLEAFTRNRTIDMDLCHQIVNYILQNFESLTKNNSSKLFQAIKNLSLVRYYCSKEILCNFGSHIQDYFSKNMISEFHCGMVDALSLLEHTYRKQNMDYFIDELDVCYEEMTNICLNHIFEYKDPQIISLLTGLNRASFYAPQLLDKLLEKIQKNVNMLSIQNYKHVEYLNIYKLERFLHSLSLFQHSSIYIPNILANNLYHNNKEINTTKISLLIGILHSLCILYKSGSEEVSAVIEYICLLLEEEKITDYKPTMEDIHKIYFVHLYLDPHNIKLINNWAGIAKEGIMESKTHHIISNFHKDIYQHIQNIFPKDYLMAMEDNSDGISKDITIYKKGNQGQKLCIECHGPSHFARNLDVVLGPTRLKENILLKQGWSVLPINYYDYSFIPHNKQEIYITELLNALHII